MRAVRNILTAAAAAGVFALLYVPYALRQPIQAFDEPLWFMRSQVTPAELSTRRYRFWAVDIPGVNRWVYRAVLKSAGLDRVPPGEKPCWSYAGGDIFWGDSRVAVRRSFTRTPEEWEAGHGRFAPRSGIMAMRLTNLAAFAACLACLYATAWLVLRSMPLSLVAVLPLVLSPLFTDDIAFIVSSGDVFLAAGLAATLLAWTWTHLRGVGVSRAAIILVSVLAGLATSAKHPGVLAVAGYMAYLAWQSRGVERILNPVMAALISFSVFAVMNPVVMMTPGTAPWAVCWTIITRRAVVAAAHAEAQGTLSLVELLNNFWWPLFPLGLYALWASRKERWWPAVGLWGAALIVGMLGGVIVVRNYYSRYMAPLEMGLFFPAAVSVLSLAKRAALYDKLGRSTPPGPPH